MSLIEQIHAREHDPPTIVVPGDHHEVAVRADAAQIAAALHAGGAKLLLGTDTPNPYVVPGFSIHDELEHFVAAGLSPFEAYCAGSRDAAVFLGESEAFGTIAVGQRADLVLLEKNPLENVQHFRSLRGVVLRGAWYSRLSLERRLELLAKKYAPKKDDDR